MGVETIPYKILHNGERWSDRPAYHVREGDAWRTTTWGEYAGGVRAAARSLLALDVAPGEAVTILGFNRPEWVSQPNDWGRQTVQGAGYELTSGEGRRIWDHCRALAASRERDLQVGEGEERYGQATEVIPRIGQGIF